RAKTDRRSLGRDERWNLTPEVWREIAGTNEKEGVLSGTASDILLTARLEQFRLVQQAEGEAGAFQWLVPRDKEFADLTRFLLQSEAVDEVLSNQPLTIWDPKAVGRRHLFWNETQSPGAASIPPILKAPPPIPERAAEDEPPNALLPPPVQTPGSPSLSPIK
ncbi:MAG: hypothetical protein U0903_16320, partial [Planctomycetales bacterium]